MIWTTLPRNVSSQVGFSAACGSDEKPTKEQIWIWQHISRPTGNCQVLLNVSQCGKEDLSIPNCLDSLLSNCHPPASVTSAPANVSATSQPSSPYRAHVSVSGNREKHFLTRIWSSTDLDYQLKEGLRSGRGILDLNVSLWNSHSMTWALKWAIKNQTI